MDAEEKPAKPEGMQELHSGENEMSVSANSSQDATFSHPRENMGQSGSFGAPGDRIVYPPAVYAPQAQAFYYRGYDNTTGEWDEYPAYVNTERLEIGSPGLYNDNPSLVFHSGYGYSPQMPYGPYSPVATPLPSIGGDAQLYPPQQYPFSPPPYLQQLGSPSLSYISSTTPVPHPEPNTLAGIDQHGDSMLFGPSPSYPPPLGSFGRGSFSGNFGAGLHDLQRGLRSGGLWSDWSKPSDRHRPLTPLSPAVTPQPIGSFESFFQNAGMASQHQRSFYGLGSGSNSCNRGFSRSGYNLGSSFGRTSLSSFGTKCRHWLSLDNSRWRGNGNVTICGCNGDMEQNRGPRASKPKSQNTTEHSSSVDINKKIKFTAKIHDDSCNQSDFATEYKDAKLFIIKSYSEDNVHKCIKYGVWASTQNGNKKLDTAYYEAKKKENPCPVFLFFSVNASAQFCGVAEMVGPVDFDKSVNYWQQDKWSGQFPVKWHIIKDVPNSQFRHIILENNDNKPVTNSRDMQKVKLEQGIEMLNIFKNYETDMSILDDFDYYEGRQKAMQERRAKQQASLIAIGAVGENNQQATVNLTTDFIKQMSKRFAQEVCLDDSGKDGAVTGRAGSDPGGSMDSRVKLEHRSTGVPSAQTS